MDSKDALEVIILDFCAKARLEDMTENEISQYSICNYNTDLHFFVVSINSAMDHAIEVLSRHRKSWKLKVTNLHVIIYCMLAKMKAKGKNLSEKSVTKWMEFYFQCDVSNTIRAIESFVKEAVKALEECQVTNYMCDKKNSSVSQDQKEGEHLEVSTKTKSSRRKVMKSTTEHASELKIQPSEEIQPKDDIDISDKDSVKNELLKNAAVVESSESYESLEENIQEETDVVNVSSPGNVEREDDEKISHKDYLPVKTNMKLAEKGEYQALEEKKEHQALGKKEEPQTLKEKLEFYEEKKED